MLQSGALELRLLALKIVWKLQISLPVGLKVIKVTFDTTALFPSCEI